LVLFGIGAFIAGLGGIIAQGKNAVGLLFAGLMLGAIGVVVWKGAKTTYRVFLATAGGDIQALATTDAEFFSRITRAIDEALIARSRS
jgi:ABC-type Co2+ transport system permease subunit